MLKVIRSLLLKIVDDIDAGNSNISEGEALEIVDSLKRFTDKEKRLSKYAACEYLNVSRATFDIRVRDNLTLSFCLYCKYFTYTSKNNLFTML